MKVLITGANGFIGKNLIARLVDRPDIDILHYSTGTSRQLLERNLRECDFLFHFAAVHRPKDNSEFYRVNNEFFGDILTSLQLADNRCPILLTSSIQASDNNDYGRSKRIAEKMLREHAEKMRSQAIIYRLLNTFGRWARPNSHSVVATFCHNIARDLPITISNREIEMRFYYIDDVIDSFVDAMDQLLCPQIDTDRPENSTYSERPELTSPSLPIHTITLGQLADTLQSFRASDRAGLIPELSTDMGRLLWETYKSYRPHS